MKKQARRIAISALLLVLAFFPLQRALAQPQQEIVEGIGNAIEGAELNAWEGLLNNLPDQVRQLWDDESIVSVIEEYALGEGGYLGDSLITNLFSIFQESLPGMLGMLLKVLAVSLLSGFVKALSDAGITGLSDIAGFVCHCFAIIIALQVFFSLAALSKETMQATAHVIEVAFPALLTLLTAAGGIASSGIFQPAMTLLCSGISTILQNVVLPIILAGAAMAVLNHMTGRVQLGQLFSLSKSTAKWIIGLLFTFYFAITSVQGMTAAAFDGVSVRTAKYAIDKLVPIVGGMVSGTVDTMLGCAVLVKNAAGIAAILIAFGVVCMPFIQIGAGIFSFRIAAALSEPVADPRIPKMLGALADVLTYLLAATIALSIMFIITVGLMMRVGGMALS